jgi:hypothetical protein
MIKYILLIPLSVFTLAMSGQIRQQYVIASTGGFKQSTDGSASYTVGEMSMVTTFRAGGYMLTQGFQQASIVASPNNGGQELPVTLIAFSGYYNQGPNHLLWETASEINNDHFDIERMDASGSFRAIGTVKGAGTTEVQHDYTLDDKEPLPGDNYYRLKQVDADGNFTYSDIISISTPATDVMTVSVSPNPVTSYVNVNFAATDSHSGILALTDVVGKTAYQEQVSLSAGITQVRIDMSAYQPGQYFIKFTSNAVSTVSRIVRE